MEKLVKQLSCHNPVMTQKFGADPYAMVYKDRVYLYMTADTLETDEAGNIKENSYSIIDTINVISSADLVNWTDHGGVLASSEKGAAKWGRNSWAPAAAYKNINGKDQFFLYFANSGNGIAVLQADSPTGPFYDPIGGPLVSREVPTCAEVTWLFDPAVLMDDDGNAYLYFGGGVPSPEACANPGTARVVKLGADMISLDGDPKVIENVSYLFEDSGINKIGDTYYYSYCSNFSVPNEKIEELGFGCGEIIVMKSKDPMGPFEMDKSVLKNPQFFFGRGGNNHHCMFEFKDKFYMAYHTRILEEAMDINAGYRSTNIDEVTVENGEIKPITGTREGVPQVGHVNPYHKHPMTMMSHMCGMDVVADVNGQAGDTLLVSKAANGWIAVQGVDFRTEGTDTCQITAAAVKGSGKLEIHLDVPEGTLVGSTNLIDNQMVEVKLSQKITGVHDLFFVYEGTDYEVKSWQFL